MLKVTHCNVCVIIKLNNFNIKCSIRKQISELQLSISLGDYKYSSHVFNIVVKVIDLTFDTTVG